METEPVEDFERDGGGEPGSLGRVDRASGELGPEGATGTVLDDPEIGECGGGCVGEGRGGEGWGSRDDGDFARGTAAL